jgi:glycosyltransferase involved in cell wall biosynthesis
MSAQSIRVMFITRKWPPAVGGMETWSVRLAEELARIGPVEVVALPGRADGRPPAIAKLLAFPLTVIQRFASAMPKPDVIHLGDMALWPLGVLASRGRRLILSAHGTDVSYHRRGGMRGTLYRGYLRLGARLLPRARVLANSAATAEAAAETGWQVAGVIPLGTDLRAGDAAPEAPGGTILFAGRLIAQKGCGWFVREVMPRLPHNFTLQIAGTIPDGREAWVSEHPRVEFLGPLDRDRLEQAYARATCVIVPNIELPNGEFEGFGLVACEAASAGGVVLAARTGGLVDAVKDGETGILLPPGDAEAWAEAIETVFAWPAERRAAFVHRAARLASALYAWPRVARATAEHYAAAA